MERPEPTKDRAVYAKVVGCEVKKPFASRADALIDLPTSQRAYLCRFCSKWHRASKAEFSALRFVRHATPPDPKPKQRTTQAARETAQKFYALDLTPAISRALLTQIHTRTNTKVIRHPSKDRRWMAVKYENRVYLLLYNQRQKHIEEFGSLIGETLPEF